jgi:uncharacterized coiled-coil DUF342 family protein
MGRKDREYRRRQRQVQSDSSPAAPVEKTPEAEPERMVSIPEVRMQGWLEALSAAKSDQAELQELRAELERSRTRIRNLESRIAELDEALPTVDARVA